MAPTSEPCTPLAELAAAAHAAKQQKLGFAEYNSNPLSEAGVLQRVLDYVGPGHWLPVAFVSKAWHKSYQRVSNCLITWRTVNYHLIDIKCAPRMTLLSAALGSSSLLQLACELGLQLDSERPQFALAVGAFCDTAVLSTAHELGVPYNTWVARGVALSGCLEKLNWLAAIVDDLSAYADICDAAAASGNIAMLTHLKENGAAFTETTMVAAAGTGRTHVIEYLHAEGCAWNEHACATAAIEGELEALHCLIELGCQWDAECITNMAVGTCYMPLLRFLRAHGIVFTKDNMVHSVATGHTAVCDYLLAEQCPLDSAAYCFAAATEGQVSTLQWLLEHGCPYTEYSLWTVAAEHGRTSVLEFLQLQGINAPDYALRIALLWAGANHHLATAQWLRAYGVEWPGVLSTEGANGELKQWEGAILEWA
jgi:hypothetical protein